MMGQRLLLLVLSIGCCLTQGCIPMASGFIAYSSAISAQQHAAYADYIFAVEAHNKILRQEGQPIEPTLSKERWLHDIYKPKLAYAEYYESHTKEQASSNSVISFEIW